jgi:hypothetical protein
MIRAGMGKVRSKKGVYPAKTFLGTACHAISHYLSMVIKIINRGIGEWHLNK